MSGLFLCKKKPGRSPAKKSWHRECGCQNERDIFEAEIYQVHILLMSGPENLSKTT
jgi:hypothetical protein